MSEYKEALEVGENNYTLIINYRAMGYLELINAFELYQPVYFFLFLVLSISTLLGVFILYGFNKLIGRFFVKNPPRLRLLETFTISFKPVIRGTFIGTIPFALLDIFIYLLHTNEILSN